MLAVRFVFVLLPFTVLGLVFFATKPRYQEINWKEHFQSDIF